MNESIDLTEAERKLIRKLERDEKRLRITYFAGACSLIVCLAAATLGFAKRDKGLVWLGLFSFLSCEILLISARNNSKQLRLIKKLMEQRESPRET